MFFVWIIRNIKTRDRINIAGFTLMELMVVVVIMGLLSTAGVLTFNKVNSQHRASTIVSDVGQIQISLAAYKGDLKVYPQNLVGGNELRGTGATTSTIYMAEVPVPPTIKDGDCADYPMYNSYYYVPSSDYKNYCLYFCLSVDSADLTAGPKIAQPEGIYDGTLGQANCFDCRVNCNNRTCGSDGCGGSCGTCATGFECVSYNCVETCVPNCSGKTCGDDGCGGSCGSCGAGESCVDGGCVCSTDEACGLCQKCVGGSCVNQTDGEDTKSECTAFTCTSVLKGFNSNVCEVYGSATAANGTCNGSGACNAYTASCTGAATHQTCGSLGCINTCPAGALTSTYPNLGDVCYADSAQHSCDSGYTCSATATCVACSDDTDCDLCEKCSDGVCTNQTDAEDTKDECDTTSCNTGTCDGSGACGVYDDGAQHNCAAGQVCSAGSCTDVYTKLLLHMDGVDDGTTFEDSSDGAKTVTRVNALTKTAVKKFGTASGYFDGNGDYLTLVDSDDWDFGSGDFTVDYWMKLGGTSATYFVLGQTNSAFSDWSLICVIENNTGTYKLRCNVSVGTTDHGIYSDAAFQDTTNWHHIAFVRSSATLMLFVDGVKQATTRDVGAGSLRSSAGSFAIGRCGDYNSGALGFNGYIDEFRVSKGFARWTANFTPPVAPY